MKRFIRKAVFLIITSCLVIVVHYAVIPNAFSEKTKQEPRYVGMEKCKNCHAEHVKTYSEWKYSRNFRVLEMRGKDRDPECLRCHTTGYGKDGGFVDIEKTPDMKNVQCEACHGPASLHVDAPTVEVHQRTLSIPRNICTTCHYQHKHMGY
ncbi:MAG: cytochrome c family protein [Proteobacteria bacterium]|nr:cytochrome c family protein [Pseudomonadota bacterium]